MQAAFCVHGWTRKRIGGILQDTGMICIYSNSSRSEMCDFLQEPSALGLCGGVCAESDAASPGSGLLNTSFGSDLFSGVAGSQYMLLCK